MELAADTARLADQHEESCLESILRVGVVAEDTAAHSKNHRSVPQQQRFEGFLVPARDVALQQLAIRKAGSILPEGGSAQMVDHAVQYLGRHPVRSRAMVSTLLLVPASLIYFEFRQQQ